MLRIEVLDCEICSFSEAGISVSEAIESPASFRAVVEGEEIVALIYKIFISPLHCEVVVVWGYCSDNCCFSNYARPAFYVDGWPSARLVWKWDGAVEGDFQIKS